MFKQAIKNTIKLTIKKSHTFFLNTCFLWVLQTSPGHGFLRVLAQGAWDRGRAVRLVGGFGAGGAGGLATHCAGGGSRSSWGMGDGGWGWGLGMGVGDGDGGLGAWGMGDGGRMRWLRYMEHRTSTGGFKEDFPSMKLGIFQPRLITGG